MIIQSVLDIGQVIRVRRKELRLTQQELAGLCGLGERFISELERGKATIESGKMIHVLQMLGLQMRIENKS